MLNSEWEQGSQFAPAYALADSILRAAGLPLAGVAQVRLTIELGRWPTLEVELAPRAGALADVQGELQRFSVQLTPLPATPKTPEAVNAQA